MCVYLCLRSDVVYIVFGVFNGSLNGLGNAFGGLMWCF